MRRSAAPGPPRRFPPSGRSRRMSSGSQQIRTVPLEFSGAGSGQYESRPRRFDQIMDLIQQCRNLLDFVDDDRAARVGFEMLLDLGSEPVRGFRVRKIGPLDEKVDVQVSALQESFDLGAFARLPGAQQQAALCGRQLERSFPHVPKIIVKFGVAL